MPLLLEIYDPDAAKPHRSTSPYYAHHPAQSHSSNTLPYEPRRRKPFEPRWDPSQLSYSPRMTPPRTTPHPSTFAPPPEPSPWPGPQQMQQLSEDFDRLTERGMAKFGSALSSLRQKAEAAGTVAPQRKLANEKPKGETVDYDTLIKSWPASPPKRS